MSLIAGTMLSTFPMFARSMTYSRGATTTPILGFKRDVRPEELVGEMDQIDCVIVMRAPDLQAAGFWPPQKNDRIVDNGTAFKVWGMATEYDAETAVFVRLKVLG